MRADATPLPRDTSARIREQWIQLHGNRGQGWPQLAGLTFVDAIATIGQHLDIPEFGSPTD